MVRKKGNLLQKAMAVMLSMVLLVGLVSGAKPVQAAEESLPVEDAAEDSEKQKEREDVTVSAREIVPMVYAAPELEIDVTHVVPLGREIEEEVLAGVRIAGVEELDESDYQLKAVYNPDVHICTVTFELTRSGEERYVLGEDARVTARCEVKFKITKREVSPVVSVPDRMEFDTDKGVLSERKIEADVLKEVSVSGIDELDTSEYILDAVYHTETGICTVSFTLSPKGEEQYVLGEAAVASAECRIILRRTVKDAVSKRVEKDESIPNVEIMTGIEELADAFLSETEKEEAQTGTDIALVLSIKDAENSVSDEDKAVISTVLNDYQVGQYLDICLYKVIGDERNQITESTGKIRVRCILPEKLLDQDKIKTREFAMIRVHDGEASVLQDMDTDMASITVEMDPFSTYAIVYTDVDGTGAGNADNNQGADKDNIIPSPSPTPTPTPSPTPDNSGTNISNNTGNGGTVADTDDGDTDSDSDIDDEEEDDNDIDSDEESDDTDSNTSGSGKGNNGPRTGDDAPLEFYATVAMVSGFTYLLLYFRDGNHGMSEEKKKELISRIISWACQGGRVHRILAYAAIVLLLVYYHSIGKKTEVNWEELTSK